MYSSSETYPSAPPLLPTSDSQTVITTQPRKVTPLATSKRRRSQFIDPSCTTSTTSPQTSGPRITELHVAPHSQPQLSPIQTPSVHLPNPETVERLNDL